MVKRPLIKPEVRGALPRISKVKDIEFLINFLQKTTEYWNLIIYRLSADSDYHLMSGSNFGDAGHRSPYLSHAKRALHHLSYIPIV